MLRASLGIESIPLNEPQPDADPRTKRRAARREQSRTDILDAAEKVFGEDGIRDGSLRDIAVQSGFSTASIYLFFKNKQELLSETLTRRGDELNLAMRKVDERDLLPLEKLHEIVNVGIEFFTERPYFRLLLRHIGGGATVTGPALAEFARDVDARFRESQVLLARIVADGQETGQIRDGDARAIAHLYTVLVNEFMLFDTNPDEANIGALTASQFHSLLDGTLRKPAIDLDLEGTRVSTVAAP